MTRTRYAILALLFLTGLLVSGYSMAGRAARFNTAQDKKLWVFRAVDIREFRVGDRAVSIADSRSESGDDVVLVKFGDRELKLASTIKPGDPALPGLVRHADWLKVLRFADYGRRSPEEFKAHLEEGNDRIAIIVKRPLIGPDPRTGNTWQRDWTFDFHELLGDGTIQTESLRFPRTRGDKIPKPNELKSGTWQMEAALHLMPRTPPDSLAVGRPTAAFRGDAMKSLGWTLPAATLSATGLIVCTALAAAPRRKRED
jgi:hypothetical protein